MFNLRIWAKKNHNWWFINRLLPKRVSEKCYKKFKKLSKMWPSLIFHTFIFMDWIYHSAWDQLNLNDQKIGAPKKAIKREKL